MEGMMSRTVLGIATTMGAAMLAVNEPAQAAFPGQNGRIAYVLPLPNGSHEIYTMKPNGTDRKKLTNNLAYDTSHTYSPSGTKIAFASVREGDVSKIYTMNAKDGTDQRDLSGSTNGKDPTYSPSGTKITFVGQG